MRGPQSESFLQGQLSQDLATIDASGGWSLILRPDGVVITSCFVRRDSDGFELTLPRALAEIALARLRQFHLRVDCTMALSDALDGPFETTAELVEAGWPGVAELAAHLAPQSYGEAFVRTSVSFTKGCFTGQELVGRLDARGSSVPWRLVRAKGPSAQVIDAALRSKGPAGPQGVTTAISDDRGAIALGFVHRSLLDPVVRSGLVDVIIEELA